jgi:hypothetical protein
MSTTVAIQSNTPEYQGLGRSSRRSIAPAPVSDAGTDTGCRPVMFSTSTGASGKLRATHPITASTMLLRVGSPTSAW